MILKFAAELDYNTRRALYHRLPHRRDFYRAIGLANQDGSGSHEQCK